MPPDRTVPAALVVTGCVTNSIKPVFDQKCGTIRVAFDASSDTDEARIVVEDDGRGMPVRPIWSSP
jgi:two-component sensor histidine kinase